MSNWIKGDRYLSQAEMQHNVQIILKRWRSAGWTDTAIAATLGNMDVESTINPGRWQVGASRPQGGFGLVQWTPSTNLTDWIDQYHPGTPHDDGDVQLDRIDWEKAHHKQYYPTSKYPETFAEYTKSNKSVQYLTRAWIYNYERPGSPNVAEREKRALKWYKFISGHIPPEPPVELGIPIWMLYKFKRM